MPYSHLLNSRGELIAYALMGFDDESASSALSMHEADMIGRMLRVVDDGVAENPHLTMSVPQMLAAIAVGLGGSADANFDSIEKMLATIANTLNENNDASHLTMSMDELWAAFANAAENFEGEEVDPLAPGAPTVVLKASSDSGASNSDGITNATTPTFTITPPTGFGDARDEVATDHRRFQISDDPNFGGTEDDIDGGESGVAAGTPGDVTPVELVAGTYYYRSRIERTDHNGPWSATGTIVIMTAAPTLQSTSPADNATGVAAGASLTATFDKNIAFGTGNITIKKTSDNSTVEAFDVATEQGAGNGQVSISGAVLTINPTSDLPTVELYVQIDATAIDDLANNSYAGIASTTAWSFTVLDSTAPTLSNTSPADNATAVALAANMTATFDENVQFHTAVSIQIKKTSDNSTVHDFDETDIGGAISISGAVLTINPPTNLDGSTEYYILIGATSIKDLQGNFFAGISSTTAWSFTTDVASDPATITFVTNDQSPNSNNPYTFTGISVGTAGDSSYVLFAFAVGSNAGQSISSVTFTGAGDSVARSATKIVHEVGRPGASSARVEFWIVAAPSAAGTSGDLVVVTSAATIFDILYAAVWRVDELLSATATDTASTNSATDPRSVTLDVQAGGVAAAVLFSGAGANVDWTAGLTERFEAAAQGWTGASNAFASAQVGLTITADQGVNVEGTLVGVALR